MASVSDKAQMAPVRYSKVLWAELPYIVENEQVEHLDDLMLRRTRLGNILPKGGEGELPEIRRLCQPRMDWDDERWDSEITRYLDIWQHSLQPAGIIPIMTETQSGYLLSIDNGTQSIRALLFDLQGELVAKAKIELDAYYSSQPGWAEQDPDYFWQKLGEACQQLWQQPGVDKAQIRAVALTTQRNTVVNVDELGKPLRPAILWLDQRLAEIEKPLPWYWRVIFKLLGQSDAIDYFRRKTQANWISQNQPEVLAEDP